MIAALLILAVLCAWIGCFGFARFASAYDRIHCVTFVAFTVGACITVAAFCADGASDRALKALMFFILSLANGAAVAHASGRAIMRRGADPIA